MTGLEHVTGSAVPPGEVLAVSQVSAPRKVAQALLISAIREGWIVLLVNFNAAIFFGVILLASGVGAFETIVFLGVQIGATSLTIFLWFYLLARTDSQIVEREPLMRALVQLGDGIIMAGWGGAMPLLYQAVDFERIATLVILLMAAGIASAALSAKLLRVLIIGRAILFAPSLVFLLWQQPPLWGIHSGILIFGFCISVGVGYAVHIQHLRVANLNMHLRAISDALAQSLESEKASAERSLADAALREHFLQSVTHDLRQTVDALRLFLDELSRRVTDTAQQGIVASAGRCVRSANTIIESVAQLAWIKDRVPEPTLADTAVMPLLRQIRDEIGPLAREKGLTLRVAETSAWCRADANFLERVLRNLVHNALQYTERGGVLIGVRNRAGDTVEIRVCDSGDGIPAGEMDSIFEAYHQVPEHRGNNIGNIGLGLTIVRDLVSSMGGEISVCSRQGQGSVFKVRLPAAEAPSSRPGSTACRILLVDDDPAFVAGLAKILVAGGYAVESVSGPGRIAALASGPAPAHDIAVLDYNLGAALTARDLLAAKNGIDPQRTVVVSSGRDIARTGLAGFAKVPVLGKTVPSEALLAAIADIAAGRAVTPGRSGGGNRSLPPGCATRNAGKPLSDASSLFPAR